MTKSIEELKKEFLEQLRSDLDLVTGKEITGLINQAVDISFNYGFEMGYEKGWSDCEATIDSEVDPNNLSFTDADICKFQEVE